MVSRLGITSQLVAFILSVSFSRFPVTFAISTVFHEGNSHVGFFFLKIAISESAESALEVRSTETRSFAFVCGVATSCRLGMWDP